MFDMSENIKVSVISSETAEDVVSFWRTGDDDMASAVECFGDDTCRLGPGIGIILVRGRLPEDTVL